MCVQAKERSNSMSNQYHYKRTGAERKVFVQAVSDILHQPAVYQKAPTFAYKI